MKRMLGRIRLRRMDVIAWGPAGADLGNFLSGFSAFSATFSRRTSPELSSLHPPNALRLALGHRCQN